jgi:hypothetical protein
MAKGWLQLLAFVGGLYFGREAKAKVEEVPPNIVFVPPSIDLRPDENFDAEDVVRSAMEAAGHQLGEEDVKRLSLELERRIKEVDPELSKLIKAYKRQIYLNKLEKIAIAFCDGKIDVETYLTLIKRYADKLANLEL